MHECSEEPRLYDKPNHMIGMAGYPVTATPPTFAVLAGGRVAVAWSSAVKCVACDTKARFASILSSHHALHGPLARVPAPVPLRATGDSRADAHSVGAADAVPDEIPRSREHPAERRS